MIFFKNFISQTSAGAASSNQPVQSYKWTPAFFIPYI